MHLPSRRYPTFELEQVRALEERKGNKEKEEDKCFQAAGATVREAAAAAAHYPAWILGLCGASPAADWNKVPYEWSKQPLSAALPARKAWKMAMLFIRLLCFLLHSLALSAALINCLSDYCWQAPKTDKIYAVKPVWDLLELLKLLFCAKFESPELFCQLKPSVLDYLTEREPSVRPSISIKSFKMQVKCA